MKATFLVQQKRKPSNVAKLDGEALPLNHSILHVHTHALHRYRRPQQGFQAQISTLVPKMFIHKHFPSGGFASRRRCSSKMKKLELAPEPPEDVRMELLHSAPGLPEPKDKAEAKPKPKPPRFFWKCGGHGRSRPRRLECIFCLQVHDIRGLPPALDGLSVAVGWKTKGWRGELTLPVTVRGGEARFEEIFLHHCSGNEGGAMRRFCIWVALIESGGCDLGSFEVDVTGMVPIDRMDAKFGGKVQKFQLCGQGKGGELSVSVYCRMLGMEFSGPVRQRSGDWLHENNVHGEAAAEPKQDDQQIMSECKCLPRFRGPKSRKIGKLTSSQHRRSSFRTVPSEQYGFITMDSFADSERRSGGALSSAGEGNSGFKTMEKDAVCPPPSSSSFDADDNNCAAPCLLTGYTSSEDEDEKGKEMEGDEDTDVERIQEEFLQMLEDEKGISTDVFTCDSPDAELMSLIKMAEADMAESVRSRRGRARATGAALEREEYDELLNCWGSSTRKLNASTSFSTSPKRHRRPSGPFGSAF